VPAAPVVGIFVGLTTLDTVYGVDRPPLPDEKIVAREFFVGAGGPATNAAITFARLGGRATLMSAVGSGPLADFVRSDVERFGVEHVEVAPADHPLPVSAVLVTSATGERAVVSAHQAAAADHLPAADRQPGPNLQPGPNIAHDTTNPAAEVPDPVLPDGVRVVLLDGHRPDVAHQVATHPATAEALVVLDGGSWKDDTAELLAAVDVAVCGAAFRPPGVDSQLAVLTYLLDAGPSFAAVTNGSRDVVWATRDDRGTVTPPSVTVRDTLGAGDVFHGAFAWSIAHRRRDPQRFDTQSFVAALEFGASIAAASVQHFGTRSWPAPEPRPDGGGEARRPTGR
jgi:sugar/nucleoside kinase (ribokinase family)